MSVVHSTRKANPCGICGELLPYLNSVKNPDTTWKFGKEYHRPCWYNSRPDFKCEECGETFPPNETSLFRQHWLVTHKPVQDGVEIKMYIPDGMVNDANMEQVLKENDILRASRVECLKVCSEWLTASGVPYFISDGTLLGAFRENGKMIGTDIDTDLSILEEDLEKVLKNSHLLPEGYLLDTITCGTDWAKQVNKPYVLADGAKKFTLVDTRDYTDVVKETQSPETDIYTFRTDEDDSDYLRNNYAKSNQAVHLRKWRKEWIFPLKEYPFENITVTGPNNALAYLKELYGYIGHNAFWNPDLKVYEKLPNTPADPYE